MFEGMASSLMKWEDHYYYLDRDFKLYRINSDGASNPEPVIDRALRAYTLADQGIIYILHDEQAIYPLAGVYMADFNGEDPTLIDQTRHAEYLVKVDDTVYYSRFGSIEYDRLESVD